MTNLTVAVIESHRSELTRYCTRRLGSRFDAEDAVQETLLRAWRSADALQTPGAIRAWLYRIAGNVCIDSARRSARQPLLMADFDEPLEPGTECDPAELALMREQLRLALTTAAYRLPPRQWAVLLLREVLCWPAAEVAELLATTVAAVNSALQRAHATLDGVDLERLPAAAGEQERELVRCYLSALEASDVDALAALSCTEYASAA